MSLTKNEKQGIIDSFRKSESDTGSAPVQIALLTEDIKKLQPHFQANPKDHASRRGLLKKISLRKKLLTYLKRKDKDTYLEVIGKLGLRK